METKELISQALSARENAYAPYSGFMVWRHFCVKTARFIPAVTLKMRHLHRQTVRRERLFSKQSVKENGIL